MNDTILVTINDNGNVDEMVVNRQQAAAMREIGRVEYRPVFELAMDWYRMQIDIKGKGVVSQMTYAPGRAK